MPIASPLNAADLARLFSENPAALQALFDNVPAQVLVLDANDQMVYANPELYRFSSLTPEQVIGHPVERLVGSKTFSDYKSASERLARGKPVLWQGWLSVPAGPMRYVQQTVVPCGEPGKAPRAVIFISWDLTEHKQREQDLADKRREIETAESLKASIVDNALAAIVSTDANGCIVEFNPAAEKMFGHTRASVLGKAVGEVIVPERYRAAHTLSMARLRAGEPARIMGKRMELEALRADGSEFPVDMVLWGTGVGDAVHYTASLIDTSERREAALQLQRERERLRQSEKLTAMGSLLAGVAHELNNPLAIVMGGADLLAEKSADYPALKEDVTRIREAADRCGRIVRTFLNMARNRPAARSPVVLNDLARAAADMLAYTYRTHGIECVQELDKTLPSIEADADQMGQIVLNLLVNSQQALGHMSGTKRVRLSTGSDSSTVWLRVSDTGPGVPVELSERIFEPFFSTKAEGIGTGLGLAVSRSMAREHGGDLVLEPTPTGGGASMRLWLPRRPVTANAPPATPVTTTQVAASHARILVVDDEPELANMMRSILEAVGHEVAVAESGAIALELLELARFDAIVSDLRMPDMDGAALWRAVREREPSLAARMLFVTGDTLSPGASSFLNEQQGLVLSKPFAAKDLRERVKTLLSQGD